MRVGIAQPQSLDPGLANDPGALEVVAQLFTPLLVADPASLQPQPGAAVTWTVTSDQTVFTFGLRPGARFHNGRPVEGRDVKYSLERAIRNGGSASNSLEVIVGAPDYAQHRELTAVVGIEVPDPATVRIGLSEPFADFPALLTNPSLSPLPKEAVEATAVPFSVSPVGNGPYRITRQWDQRSPIDLVATTDTAIVSGAVKAVRFQPFGDLSLGLLALRGNEVDVVSVPPAVLPAVDVEHEDLRKSPFLGSYYFAFNLRDPNLAKPEFRKAILAAIDRPSLVRDVLKSALTPRSGVVPAVFPGWPNDACGDPCATNPGNARAFLVAAFPDGQIPPVNLDVDADATQQAVATAMRDQLRAVGIPANVRSKPYAEYRAFLTGAVAGDPGLFRSGWVTAAPTPDQFLVPLFASGRPDNLTGYTNPDLDQLLSDTRKEPDSAKRFDNYRQAEARVLADAAVVPIASLQTYWVVRRGIDGLQIGPTGTFAASTVRSLG